MTRWLRGIIHCHSHHSHDSLAGIGAYLTAARRHALDFIVLTDHETIAGSKALAEAARRQMPQLRVPVAAEYNTSLGDVIAVFLDDDIEAMEAEAFFAEARAKDALLLLPHPYVAHRQTEWLAERCDLVETINCRASATANGKATALAAQLGKRSYVASDAHFSHSLGNAILEVEDLGALRPSLTHGQIRWAPPRLTGQFEYGASQLISAIKLRDMKRFRTLAGRTVKQLRRKVGGA
ncbi:MAG TPA: PHP-associated domain-containing protein [Rhizomicrobium sp.]|nr:PHP-associated domain-containing protein [Rhizomicrobium sp.]